MQCIWVLEWEPNQVQGHHLNDFRGCLSGFLVWVLRKKTTTQEHACSGVTQLKYLLTALWASKSRKKNKNQNPLYKPFLSALPHIHLLLSLFHAPVSHCYSAIDKPLLWYLCHIFNMDMGMIIKSIVAKSVRSALNNGWARMRLNLWGRAERRGKCSHRPLRPSPSFSPLSGTSLFWSIFSPLAWHHSM